MDLFDDEKDFYYVDLFNSVPTDQEEVGVLTTSKNGLESTIRLYTTENNALKRCLLVAPYIEPESYSGMNTWTQGGNSLVDIMVETATGIVKNFNDSIKDLMDDSNRFLESYATAGWVKSMVSGLKGIAENTFKKLPSSDYQTFNLGQFKRAFGGTSVPCPISSMSTILFSNPESDDYNWFGGKLIKTQKQPLRYLCATLLYYLLGRMSGMVAADSSNSGNNKKDAKFAALQFAPNFINARQTINQRDEIIPRTFALVVGCGGKPDNKINSPSQSVDGTPKIIWNILPTQLTISPSRLLTPSDDYYYVKIDLSFEMAGYLDSSTLAEQWVGTNMDTIAQVEEPEKSAGKGDPPGS